MTYQSGREKYCVEMKAIPYAFLAAVFYAINIPASKVLLRDVGPTTMAALLYLGAGIGIAILSLLNAHGRKASAPLTHQHTFTHFHGGYVHTHTITHAHGHDHFRTDANHAHRHTLGELERLI